MGTTYDADCGDGCCHIRNKCTECNGLGYVEKHGLPKGIEDISDHMALSCTCGSVGYSLLKSGKIECGKCLTKELDLHWHTNDAKASAKS